MGRNRRSEGEQFALPLWDVWKDVEEEYQVEVLVRIEMAPQRGVFDVVMRARDMAPNGREGIIATISQPWPNSTVMELTALLYNLAFKLGRQVEESRRDEHFRALGRKR